MSESYDRRVSFEIAKSLKEINFCDRTNFRYSPNGTLEEEVLDTNKNKLGVCFSHFHAPSLDQVVRFLISKYRILVSVLYMSKSWTYQITYLDINKGCYNSGYDSYDDALEEGIKKAIELIRKLN